MAVTDKKIRQKKIVRFFMPFFCFFSLSVLAPGASIAAPVGNPAGPVLLEGNYPTKFSLETDVVLERKLKTKSSGSATFHGRFYMGKASLYTGNKVDIYGLVGLGEGKVKNFINDSYIIDSKSDIAYGAGVSYVLHELECMSGLLRLGADAKFRQFRPNISTVTRYREQVAVTNDSLTFTEWQVALGLAYQYKKFIPYLGTKYSGMRARIKFTQGSTSVSDNDVEASNAWGLFYGMDVLLSDNMSFNIEARSFDESAISTSLNFRF